MDAQKQAEHGRRGGLARSAAMTAEERRKVARKAHLAGAVNAVVNRREELAEEQVERIRSEYCR